MLEQLTGSPYFPGGLGEFVATRDEFLVFEEGPSVDVVLQWATYRDAAAETSLSRIWGGIHPPIDDIPGRRIGPVVAGDAVNLARRIFAEEALLLSSDELTPVAATVFPNPVGAGLPVRVRLPEQLTDVRRLVLYSSLGQAVREVSVRQGVAELSTSGLVPGMYVVADPARRVVGKLLLR